MSQITLIFIRHGEAASSWVSHEDPGLSIKGQIENSKKQKWLEDIIKMDKKELPQKIIDWEKAIFDKVLTAEKNTVIFSHFMVINSIVSNLIKSNSIFYFYPDNASITKIFLEKGKVVSFQIGNDKKTHINL